MNSQELKAELRSASLARRDALIDPRPLMDEFRKLGARLCLPVVLDKTTIVFRELVRGAELVDTGFGTRGPAEDAEILDPHGV